MPILVLRSVKGSELEYFEHDDNHKLSVLTIESVSSLRLSLSDFNKQLVFVEGRINPNDGFNGNFYWDAASTELDDDQDIFQVTGNPVGRWKRIDPEAKIVSALDVSFDDTIMGTGLANQQQLDEFFDDQIGLRETAATGIINGGGGSIVTSTTIAVNVGNGEIVDGYSDRVNPAKTKVTWAADASYTINMPDIMGIQVVYADASNLVKQQSMPLSESQRRTIVQIAFVYYRNGAIVSLQHAGIHSNEVGNTLYDLIYRTPFASRVTGMGVRAVTGALSVFADAGDFFTPGISVATDLTNPNIGVFSAIGNVNTPAVFDVIFADGTTYLAAQTVIPTVYESAPGVVTAVGGNDATIGYMHRDFGNKFLYQLGTNLYTTGAIARDSLEVDRDTHVPFFGSQYTLPSAQIYVNNGASNFNNSNQSGIVSLIGSGAGPSGSVAVSTILDLTDVTPNSFIGNNGRSLKVKVDELAMDFFDVIDLFGQFIAGGPAIPKFSLVVDSGYSGVTINSTVDSPAPQLTGLPEHTIDQDLAFTSQSDVSVIKQVHAYVFTKDVIVDLLQFQVPFYDLDSVTRVTIVNQTSGTTEVVANPILKSGEWVIIRLGNVVFRQGDVAEVWLEYYNSSAANNITGGWTSNQGTGLPNSTEFNINNLSNPTVIEIHHTDLDATSRATELDGVTVNSIITISETADATRSVEVTVNAIDTAGASSTKYSVTLLQNGDRDIRDNKTCTVSIDVPITQPSQYSVLSSYWLGTTNQPNYATVTSKLFFDGVSQASTTDAYGIDFRAQPAYISPDYTIIASPSGGSSSTSGGASKTLEIRKETASTSLVLTDSANVVEINNASPVNLLIAANAGTAYPIGFQCIVRQTGVGAITFVPAVGVTPEAEDGLLTTAKQYTAITLYQSSLDVWAVIGNLV